MKKSMIAGSVLFLTIAGFAVGQGIDTQKTPAAPTLNLPIPSFEEVDINSDGILNKTEADTALPALGLGDADQNGDISKAEVKMILTKIAFEADDMEPVGPEEYLVLIEAMEDLMGPDS